MTPRDNLLSLLRREGYEYSPVDFSLCPSLYEKYIQYAGTGRSVEDYFQFPWRGVEDIRLPKTDYFEVFRPYYGRYVDRATIDCYGVVHEPGSAAAMHMTYMRHPLEKAQTVAELEKYPFPDYAHGDSSHQAAQVKAIHDRGLAAKGDMAMTVWECSWYMRSMEELMMDMMEDDPRAAYLLDRVTESAAVRARAYARAGADILHMGDDIGMQHSIMMSLDLYKKWLYPRLAHIIAEARRINPDILILYHSCGYVTPFIPLLMEAGVDVLNPIQPECMSFGEIHAQYGDQLSFHGTIGTQSVFPFGTAREVQEMVHKHLTIAGRKGGLFAAPTHLLEPEVPWENVLAYVEACREWRP